MVMGQTDIQAPDDRQVVSIKVHPEDRYKLLQLALDVRIKKKQFDLARLELEAAEQLSAAAGDVAVARLGVPESAEEVTLDLNGGSITYKLSVAK